MATWPESSPKPNYPLIITPRFRVLASDLDAGNEQRRLKQEFPKFDVRVTYDGFLTKAEMDVLWNFYLARKGGYEAFYIYDMADVLNVTSTSYTDLYVGTGDGSTATFDIPGRSTSSQTLYIDGVEDETAAFLTGGGDSSSDRVTPTSAPAAGEVISVDFTGIMRYRVRFGLDKGLSRELFETVYYRAGGIDLVGLRAA